MHTHTHTLSSSFFLIYFELSTASGLPPQKVDENKQTNQGCTLNSFKSKMYFGSPFLLEASRRNPPNSSGTVTSPFSDKKDLKRGI